MSLDALNLSKAKNL